MIAAGPCTHPDVRRFAWIVRYESAPETPLDYVWCAQCGALGSKKRSETPDRLSWKLVDAPRPSAEPRTKIVEVRPRWFVGHVGGDSYVFDAEGRCVFRAIGESEVRPTALAEILRMANGAANLADCEHSDVGTLGGVLWCRDCGAIKPQGVWHDTTPHRIGAP